MIKNTTAIEGVTHSFQKGETNKNYNKRSSSKIHNIKKPKERKIHNTIYHLVKRKQLKNVKRN